MSFRAGIIQLRSTRDMKQNLVDASALIRDAAQQGATFVVTPEVTNVFEPDKERLKAIALPERDDPSVGGFSALARELKIHLHIGSLALRGDDGKLVNRAILFGPDGKKITHYDKVHLFDIDLPTGESHRESATYTGGLDAVAVRLPFATLGLAICYDVRFPRLFNTLANAGADVMLVPAAFTVPTGEAHWHVLLRARAIETGSFVLAAAQGGMHDSGRATYGHSLAISPWGEILAEAGTDPCALIVEIDPAKSVETRNRIPALKHAREARLKTVSGVAS
jgi:deaminated glutathione amidase